MIPPLARLIVLAVSLILSACASSGETTSGDGDYLTEFHFEEMPQLYYEIKDSEDNIKSYLKYEFTIHEEANEFCPPNAPIQLDIDKYNAQKTPLPDQRQTRCLRQTKERLSEIEVGLETTLVEFPLPIDTIVSLNGESYEVATQETEPKTKLINAERFILKQTQRTNAQTQEITTQIPPFNPVIPKPDPIPSNTIFKFDIPDKYQNIFENMGADGNVAHYTLETYLITEKTIYKTSYKLCINEYDHFGNELTKSESTYELTKEKLKRITINKKRVDKTIFSFPIEVGQENFYGKTFHTTSQNISIENAHEWIWFKPSSFTPAGDSINLFNPPATLPTTQKLLLSWLSQFSTHRSCDDTKAEDVPQLRRK